MDIQDITNMAKNGTQIVPQFSNNGATYLKSRQDGKVHLTTPENGGYRLNGGGFVNKDNIGNATSLWDYATNLDLPENADKKVQNMTMLYNALEALKNRNFQERMYGERYQKIIKDIQKAGLNPYAINFFTPSGGFSGSSASIMSNYQAQQSNINSNVQTKSRSKIESKSQNENKNAGWMHALQAIGQIITAAVLLLK